MVKVLFLLYLLLHALLKTGTSLPKSIHEYKAQTSQSISE